MSYYIHENPRKNRVTIHQGYCPHCNYGQGRYPDRDPYVHKWSEALASLEEAEQRGKATGQKYIRRCRVCLKN
jgi:hypothetical protein